MLEKSIIKIYYKEVKAIYLYEYLFSQKSAGSNFWRILTSMEYRGVFILGKSNIINICPSKDNVVMVSFLDNSIEGW